MIGSELPLIHILLPIFTGIIEYQRMADAITAVSQQSHVPIVYSLCEWGWVCDIMYGTMSALTEYFSEPSVDVCSPLPSRRRDI